MFGKFGGIVIIALAGAIIAGLILRPTPDLPPAMNLGVPDSSAITANTLEPTVDNQDKKPAEIKPVTESVDSSETKPEDKTTETTETKSEEPTEMTADKAKAAAEKAAAVASEAVEKVSGEETKTEGTEKSE